MSKPRKPASSKAYNTRWRPDWRDKSLYPADDDSPTTNQWTWEFVRRDPRYTNAWAFYELARTNGNPSAERIASAWRISGAMPRPDDDRAPLFILSAIRHQRPRAFLGCAIPYAAPDLSDVEFQVVLDLSRPIDGQLAAVRALFMRYRDEARRSGIDLQAHARSNRRDELLLGLLERGAAAPPPLPRAGTKPRLDKLQHYLRILDGLASPELARGRPKQEWVHFKLAEGFNYPRPDAPNTIRRMRAEAEAARKFGRNYWSLLGKK